MPCMLVLTLSTIKIIRQKVILLEFGNLSTDSKHDMFLNTGGGGGGGALSQVSTILNSSIPFI